MILYLGLKAPPNAYHYPVIRTEKLTGPRYDEALSLWPRFTHVIFTSQTSVRYWPFSCEGKTVIAIGEATASGLSSALIAPASTQEGVIELLDSLDLKGAYLFLPRSKKARPDLEAHLIEKKIPHFLLDLYDTHFQKPLPVPDLDQFDEIVFTSPSTVQGFLAIFGKLPQNKKLTVIGPVTKAAVDQARSLVEKFGAK